MPALMLAIAQDPPPPIGVIRPDLPKGLQGFFDRALAKDPADRHESGAEFSIVLRDLNLPERSSACI
jgi:serine/threonine-protein kinase